MSAHRIHNMEDKKDYLAIVKGEIIEYCIKAGISDAVAFALLKTLDDNINSLPEIINILMSCGTACYGFGCGLAVCMLILEKSYIDDGYTRLYDYNDLVDYREHKTLKLKNK